MNGMGWRRHSSAEKIADTLLACNCGSGTRIDDRWNRYQVGGGSLKRIRNFSGVLSQQLLSMSRIKEREWVYVLKRRDIDSDT